jgi:hypothetical protein
MLSEENFPSAATANATSSTPTADHATATVTTATAILNVEGAPMRDSEFSDIERQSVTNEATIATPVLEPRLYMSE